MAEEEMSSMEVIDFRTKTVSGKDFETQYGADDRSDARFRYRPPKGAFEFPPLAALAEKDERTPYFTLLELNGLVVGVAELRVDKRGPKELTLTHISVDYALKGLKLTGSEEEKSMMLAERLVRAVFSYAKEKKMAIRVPGLFGVTGEILRKLLNRVNGEEEFKTVMCTYSHLIT